MNIPLYPHIYANRWYVFTKEEMETVCSCALGILGVISAYCAFNITEGAWSILTGIISTICLVAAMTLGFDYKHTPNSEAHYQLGKRYYFQKEMEKAKTHFRAAGEHPESKLLLFELLPKQHEWENRELIEEVAKGTGNAAAYAAIHLFRMIHERRDSLGWSEERWLHTLITYLKKGKKGDKEVSETSCMCLYKLYTQYERIIKKDLSHERFILKLNRYLRTANESNASFAVHARIAWKKLYRNHKDILLPHLSEGEIQRLATI